MLTQEGLHQHACVVCQQRKVKCDRQDPTCSNCIRGNAECIYRTPPPPRRRKRKPSGTLLQSRLKRCEELLQRHGIPLSDAQTVSSTHDHEDDLVEEGDGTSLSPATVKSSHRSDSIPAHVSDAKRHKSYAKNDLWRDLQEAQQPSLDQDLSSEDEEDVPVYTTGVESKNEEGDGHWLWGLTTSMETELRYPPQHIVQVLWRTYLENVDPLMKVVHSPTVEKTIRKVGQPSEEIPSSGRALVFAIFAAAVNSVPEEDCESLLGDGRPTLLRQYRTATQHALANANFLSTKSFTVLQALIIYLISLRTDSDPPTLWAITGLAVRIAKRIGIYEYERSTALSPFEREMKGRLWFELVVLDAQVAEMSGIAQPWDMEDIERLPLNVNDVDLSPDMEELPTEVEGPTEMMLVLVRQEYGRAMRRSKIMFTPADGDYDRAKLIAGKDRDINELEALFESRFLRYCDPLVPLHLLVILTARVLICKARLAAHHPRQYKDRGASLPEEERDNLFMLSLKTLEYESLSHETKRLRGFLWYMKNHVQFTAMIYVLSELRKRTSGPNVDKAWNQIEEIYHNHPEMLREKKSPLFWSIGSLVVAAWERREVDQLRHTQRPQNSPNFVTQLRSQRTRVMGRRSDSGVAISSEAPSMIAAVPLSIYPSSSKALEIPANPTSAGKPISFDSSENLYEDIRMGFDPMSYSPLDWSAWDDMLRDFERQSNSDIAVSDW